MIERTELRLEPTTPTAAELRDLAADDGDGDRIELDGEALRVIRQGARVTAVLTVHGAVLVGLWAHPPAREALTGLLRDGLTFTLRRRALVCALDELDKEEQTAARRWLGCLAPYLRPPAEDDDADGTPTG